MIRVNLLPPGMRHERKNARRMTLIFALSMIVVLVFLSIYGWCLGKEVAAGELLLAAKRKEAVRLEAQVKKLDALCGEMDALEAKWNMVKSLERERPRPVEILGSLPETVIPRRMWLSEYRTEKGRIQITGFSLDDKAIADFMTNLEKTEFFTRVSLDGVQQKILEQVHLRSFSLSCLEREM